MNDNIPFLEEDTKLDQLKAPPMDLTDYTVKHEMKKIIFSLNIQTYTKKRGLFQHIQTYLASIYKHMGLFGRTLKTQLLASWFQKQLSKLYKEREIIR